MKSVLQTMEFNEWFNLAQEDPEAFEAIRLHMIEEVITSAPAPQRQKLRCLQWRIDQERLRSDSPMGSCLRLSRMMWERVTGENGLLENIDRLRALQDGLYPLSPPSARVIPLRPRH